MRQVPLIMRDVLLALIPGTLVMAWFFGPGVLLNVCIAALSASAFEALALTLRRKPVMITLLDGSAVLAGWLLALALPPLTPLWLTVLGTGVAMLLGKHVYGGLGFNPFNPAMVGYAFLLISFPREMTAWLAPAVAPGEWHAITMATPLDQLKTLLNQTQLKAQGATTPGNIDIYGVFAAKNWEWINIAFLAGGLVLLYRRIISWHIPITLLATLGALTTVDYIVFNGPVSPMMALFSGAAMLGAFFIATDPVSAATSPIGRLLYAFGIGTLIFCIRKWGGYPEGVAFAVLLMNFAAPTIDYYYRPPAFGE